MIRVRCLPCQEEFSGSAAGCRCPNCGSAACHRLSCACHDCKTFRPQPLPCPWCGDPPAVLPERPEREGNAWAKVVCETRSCPARPSVSDGSDVASDSIDYRRLAIERWNDRK